jgi:hypothetical protein
MQPNLAFDPTSTFFMLDFDRTLGNTDKFSEVLEKVIEEETNLTADFLRHAELQAEANGESFDTIQYLRNYLKETNNPLSWSDLERTFIIRAQQEDTLEVGAAKLLRILDEKNIRFGIITYGNEAWQLAKIEGANLLDVPRVVTRIKEKGNILTGWKQETGEFLIPPLLTKEFKPLLVTTIVFLDDKAVSFTNMPEGVIGLRVRPPEGIKLLAQQGPLPAGIIEVEGIEGAIKLLFNNK